MTAALGLLTAFGVLSTELAGAVMVAVAPLIQFFNGNNPNVVGAYNPVKMVEAETETIGPIASPLASPELWKAMEAAGQEDIPDTEE